MNSSSYMFLIHAGSVVAAVAMGTALTAAGQVLEDWLSYTVGRESRRYARRISECELEARKIKRKITANSPRAAHPHPQGSPASGSGKKPANQMPLPKVVLQQAEYSLMSR